MWFHQFGFVHSLSNVCYNQPFWLLLVHAQKITTARTYANLLEAFAGRTPTHGLTTILLATDEVPLVIVLTMDHAEGTFLVQHVHANRYAVVDVELVDKIVGTLSDQSSGGIIT
jgi:hypothetical protein